MACVYVYVIALTFFGPEALGRDFGVEADEDMEAATDGKAMRQAHHGGGAHSPNSEGTDPEKGHHLEREVAERETI